MADESGRDAQAEVERWCQAILGHLQAYVYAKDLQGRYLYVNEWSCRLLGRPAEQILGRTDFELLDEETAWAVWAGEQRVIDLGEVAGYEVKLAPPGAGTHKGCCWMVKQPLRDAQGRVIGVYAVATDISERKQQEEELLALKKQHAATLRALPDMVFELDADARFVDYHAPRLELLAHVAGPDRIRGRTLAEVLPAPVAEVFMGALREARVQGCSSGRQFRLELPNGQRWFELSVAVQDAGDQAQAGYVALSRDITDRKQAEAQIRKLAFHDALTDLPNRAFMFESLGHALVSAARRCRQGALLLIELDNFKLLNDTQGHEAGDQLLLEVAARLRACIRHGDTATRVGGDEFVVIFENIDGQGNGARQAEALARQILQRLGQPYLLQTARGAITYHCTSSIGITLFDSEAITVEELLRRCDTAMYQAKASGRNTLRFFDPQMQQAIAARATLEADLRRALAQGHFVLYLQPQVNAAGLITAAEVLVRWQHPERGLVLPGEFIALAEETSLVVPLGQWILEETCRQLALWAEDPLMAGLTLSVNVSASQLHRPAFVEQLRTLFATSGASPQKLKLELTESVLLENDQAVIDRLLELRALGLGFSLDDFGTGYSSLVYLKRLPIDQLKIDQSFVRDVLTDPNDAVIARTIVALADSLGLGVIAEGVETEAQRDFLARHGCRAYQGYLYGRPMPLEDFRASVRAQLSESESRLFESTGF